MHAEARAPIGSTSVAKWATISAVRSRWAWAQRASHFIMIRPRLRTSPHLSSRLASSRLASSGRWSGTRVREKAVSRRWRERDVL